MKTLKVCAIADLHDETLNRKALAAWGHYVAANKWDRLYLLGDILTLDAVSSYNKGKPGQEAACWTLAESWSNGRELVSWLCLQARTQNPKCEVVYCEGNHEARARAYKDKFPVLGTLCDVPTQLELKRHAVKWVPEGEVDRLRDAMFTHGWYWGMNHARQTALTAPTHIYYGHTHDVQEYSINRLGETVRAKSIGSFCEQNPTYKKGAPNRWVTAFSVFYFGPDGGHNEYNIKLDSSGKFTAPDGVLYGPRGARKG